MHVRVCVSFLFLFCVFSRVGIGDEEEGASATDVSSPTVRCKHRQGRADARPVTVHGRVVKGEGCAGLEAMPG